MTHKEYTPFFFRRNFLLESESGTVGSKSDKKYCTFQLFSVESESNTERHIHLSVFQYKVKVIQKGMCIFQFFSRK